MILELTLLSLGCKFVWGAAVQVRLQTNCPLSALLSNCFQSGISSCCLRGAFWHGFSVRRIETLFQPTKYILLDDPLSAVVSYKIN